MPPLTADVEEAHFFGRLEQLGGDLVLAVLEIAERHFNNLTTHGEEWMAARLDEECK